MIKLKKVLPISKTELKDPTLKKRVDNIFLNKYLNNVSLARFGGVDQSGVTIIIDVINVSGL